MAGTGAIVGVSVGMAMGLDTVTALGASSCFLMKFTILGFVITVDLDVED